jgi:hypothetical protein
MQLSRIRPRFTVRSMMIAVAIVGLLMGASLWIVEMRSRSVAYQIRACIFMDMDPRAKMGKVGLTKDGREVNLYDNENRYLRWAWTRELAEKYWQLAQRPWLPVEPDPPPPELLAYPRSALDCPAEVTSRGPWCRWYIEPVYPWWTFPWTWRSHRLGPNEPRWSFP